MCEGVPFVSSAQKFIVGVFYGGLSLLLLVITTGMLPLMVPSAATTRVAYNSEGYLFAVVVGAWIQFAIPRLPHRSRHFWGVVHGGGWALVGIGLLLSDLPSRIRTLNEAALALAIVVPLVTLRRPLPRIAWPVSILLIALTAWAVIWAPQSWIIDQAETFGFVVLSLLTFDVFDRILLDDNASVHSGYRWAWYAFLAAEPVTVSLIGTAARAGDGAFGLTLQYLGRIHESFVGLLLVAAILHVTRSLGALHSKRQEASLRRDAADHSP